MTQSEKLKKIIEYARENENRYDEDNTIYQAVRYYHPNLEKIIFSHSFLKAYFGEQNVISKGEEEILFYWKWEAQQLAITPEEKRIDYLYDFIKDN